MAVNNSNADKLLRDLEKDIEFSGVKHRRMLSESGENTIIFDMATIGAKTKGFEE